MKEKFPSGLDLPRAGRSFQSVLGTFIYHLEESGLLNNRNIHLNLLVAYDLTYSNTCRTDYTRIGEIGGGEAGSLLFHRRGGHSGRGGRAGEKG